MTEITPDRMTIAQLETKIEELREFIENNPSLVTSEMTSQLRFCVRTLSIKKQTEAQMKRTRDLRANFDPIADNQRRIQEERRQAAHNSDAQRSRRTALLRAEEHTQDVVRARDPSKWTPVDQQEHDRKDILRRARVLQSRGFRGYNYRP